MKHWKTLIGFCLVLIFNNNCDAQSLDKKAKIPRILFLLDGSSSMREDWITDKVRFEQAGHFILSLMDSMHAENDQVEFGLRVFGHQYPAQFNNCYDTKLEVKFQRQNKSQMDARLHALKGYGVSPIAYSLKEAAEEDFDQEEKYAYSIILVTDGAESCDGDICNVVNRLLERKVFFRPYIVSLTEGNAINAAYKCLGTLLTLTQPNQEVHVIKTIVDGHKEGFERAKTGKEIAVFTQSEPVTTKSIENIEQPKPSTNTVTEKKKEIIQIDTIVIPKKAIEAPKPLVTESVVKEVIKPKDTLIPAPKLPSKIIVTDDQRKPIKNRLVKSSKYKLVQAKAISKATPKRIAPIAPKYFALERPDTIVIPITIKQPASNSSNIASTPKADDNKVVTTPAKPKTPAKKQVSEYKIERIPSTETQVEVYFTDGKGKFYPSTPEILLTNTKDPSQKTQFFRTVNAQGNPDPRKIQSGTYSLSVIGSERTYLDEFVIEPNKINKIIISVVSGSLKFVWRNDRDVRSTKTMDKFSASVKRNFEIQPTVIQKCDTQMFYPPGNYHIEINTLPVSVRNVDLVFGALVIIGIERPGTLVVTNTEPLGKAKLYYQRGDRFMYFYELPIVGNPEVQNVELQPGNYEIKYQIASGMPELKMSFKIAPDNITNVQLTY
jgi:hypothetical protein